MTESGDSDPTAPKEMQKNPPNPTGEGSDRDLEAGERALEEEQGSTSDEQFVVELESDPARAGSDAPGEDLIGG